MAIDFTTLNQTSGTGKSGSSATAADDPGSEDRFLKLLITQIQNQDPLKPMDNAQVTTQIARSTP